MPFKIDPAAPWPSEMPAGPRGGRFSQSAPGEDYTETSLGWNISIKIPI